MKTRSRVASRPGATALLATTLLASVGCGEPDWRMEPPLAFQPGEVVGPGVAADPRVEVVEPATEGKIRAKPGEPLPLRVRLTFSEGGRTPVFLTAFIRDGKADSGSFALTPIVRSGKAFTLGATLTTPHKPGVYRLEVDAVYLDFEATSKIPSGQPPKDRHVLAKVADLEVRR